MLGIIVQIISNQNFEFAILEAKKSHFSYTQTQRILLPFMSAYYMQSIGITAQVFTPKDMRLGLAFTQVGCQILSYKKTRI